MARFWALMTFAVTVLLSGLAAMTEDRSPPEGASLGFSATVPSPTPVPMPLVPDDAAGRRSYERRHQRQPSVDAPPLPAKPLGSAEPATLTTGSVALASLATGAAPEARPSELGPVVPVPIPVQRLGEGARTTGTRKPLSREAPSATGHRLEFVTAVDQRQDGEARAAPHPADAGADHHKPVKTNAGDIRYADAGKRDRGHRKAAGVTRAAHSQGGARRSANRHSSIRPESLWPRAQRDGS